MTPPLSPISQWQWQWWWWSLAELGKNNIYGSRTVMRDQGNIFEGCKWAREERKRDVPPARECKYKTSEEERGVNIEASKYGPSQIQAIRNLFASAKHKGYGSRIWIGLNLQLQKALPFAYCDHHSKATNTRIVFCCPPFCVAPVVSCYGSSSSSGENHFIANNLLVLPNWHNLFGHTFWAAENISNTVCDDKKRDWTTEKLCNCDEWRICRTGEQ